MQLARDACYSLFSIFAIVCILGATPPRKGAHEETDPWEEDAKEGIRLEDEKRAKDIQYRAALEKQVRDWIPTLDATISDKVAQVTLRGSVTAPKLEVILQDIRQEVRGSADTPDVQDRKLHEIDCLAEDLANWEPVYKWDGPSCWTDGEPSRTEVYPERVQSPWRSQSPISPQDGNPSGHAEAKTPHYIFGDTMRNQSPPGSTT